MEAVAADVNGFAVGDEVVGLLRFPTALQGGAYAEYVTAPASDLARKPAAIDHVHAAGLPMSGLTAWQFLIELGHDHPSPFQEARHRPMALDSQTTVLINGAAGGVGHLALQLAKWKGARVIAVASGAHETFPRKLGADEFIDYAGTVRVAIDSTFALADARAAHERAARGHIQGKIVLTVA